MTFTVMENIEVENQSAVDPGVYSLTLVLPAARVKLTSCPIFTEPFSFLIS